MLTEAIRIPVIDLVELGVDLAEQGAGYRVGWVVGVGRSCDVVDFAGAALAEARRGVVAKGGSFTDETGDVGGPFGELVGAGVGEVEGWAAGTLRWAGSVHVVCT